MICCVKWLFFWKEGKTHYSHMMSVNQKKYIAKLEEEIENLDPRVDKRKIQSREQKIANIRAGVFTTKKELELIRPVSLGSSVDLPQLMYSEEGFNFEVIKKNDSGKPSTDEETLTNLRLTVKKA